MTSNTGGYEVRLQFSKDDIREYWFPNSTLAEGFVLMMKNRYDISDYSIEPVNQETEHG